MLEKVAGGDKGVERWCKEGAGVILSVIEGPKQTLATLSIIRIITNQAIYGETPEDKN